MARVTVEDCERVVPNRFDLVVLAAQRTRQIIMGSPLTIDGNDEKKPVIALREIAARTVSADELKDAVINNFRTYLPSELEDMENEDMEDDTYNPYIGLEMSADDVDAVAPSEDLPDVIEDDIIGADSDSIVAEDIEETSEEDGVSE